MIGDPHPENFKELVTRYAYFNNDGDKVLVPISTNDHEINIHSYNYGDGTFSHEDSLDIKQFFFKLNYKIVKKEDIRKLPSDSNLVKLLTDKSICLI